MEQKKKRMRLEIIRDVLKSVNNPISKTRIMYRANMSHSMTEEFLEICMKNNLITKVKIITQLRAGKGRKAIEKYIITGKGRKCLTEIGKIENSGIFNLSSKVGLHEQKA